MITPILRKPHTDDEGTEGGAEARMRQALGKLGTAKSGKPEAPRRTIYQATPGAGQHRFRQDGEVPVVRLSMGKIGGGKERQSRAPTDGIEAGVVQGQAGRGTNQDGQDSARQVQELAEQLRVTQTRLGHAELTAAEAIKVGKARQEEAAGLRLALDAVEATLARLHAELAASKRTREELERCQHAPRRSGLGAEQREDTATRRKVGRPLGSTSRSRAHVPDSEPEPVRWWAGS